MNSGKVSLIIGGGLSSLMIAKMIRKYKDPDAEIIIIEKENTVGGQFGSVHYNGYGYFDFGMHIYYDSCVDEIDSLFLSILPEEEWNIMEGNYKDVAGIFFNGKLQLDFPYPDLRNVPAEKKKNYISDLFLTIEKTKDKPLCDHASAYEKLESHFGKLITDDVFVPILEKLYHHHPSRLAETATLITKIDRVALFDEETISDLMKSPSIQARICHTNQLTLPAVRKNKQRALYPKQYGMFRVLEKLKTSLENEGVKFYTSATVADLKIENHTIKELSITHNKEVKHFNSIEKIYWTAGFPALSCFLKLDLSQLKFDKQINKAYYVNFLFDKELTMGPLYYFYCFDKGYRTFRVTNYSNYCKTASENRGYPVCVEFWATENDPTDDAAITMLALSELKSFGVVGDDNRVLFSNVNKEHGAGFPLPTLNNINNMQYIREKIASLDISNLIMAGVHSNKNVFFINEVLKDAYHKVIQSKNMKINELPLYWRLKEKDSPNIVPDYMPFEYDFIEPLQLIIQKRNNQTLAYLEEIYKAESNIGYLQDANEIAKPYGVDFMDFIERSLTKWGKETKNILEVGCGGCTILQQLKEQGYEVIGVDPSPIAKRDGERKGIKVINEFFPTPLYSAEVDLIFHCDVLEHVPDPVRFLNDQKKQLSKNGLLIISLPDCNEGIEKGEISMTMHQHLNYFDNEGLKNTVEAAGLKVLVIETAKYGGSLYCCAINSSEENSGKIEGTLKFETFKRAIETTTQNVMNHIKPALNDPHKSVGFYVPLRTLPYISMLKQFDGFRFFDDTHHWYNRAFDGVEVYIENFNDLKNRPVTDLFIMSLTFGDVIKKKIESQIPGIQTIKVLKEMIE